MTDETDDNVIPFPGVTRLPIPAERVIEAALKAGIEDVLILGWLPDGGLYFASSMPDEPSALWLLEIGRNELINQGYE